MKKKVLLLNGPSSSGKSTLAKTLRTFIRDKTNQEYDVVSIDHFLKMTTEETIYEEDVFQVSSTLCEKAIEALARKQGVIIDHVITSERIFRQLTAALAACDIFLIRVDCPLRELKRRETQRGDRRPGSAEASRQYLFPKEGYRLTVDTFASSPAACSLRIIDCLNEESSDCL